MSVILIARKKKHLQKRSITMAIVEISRPVKEVFPRLNLIGGNVFDGFSSATHSILVLFPPSEKTNEKFRVHLANRRNITDIRYA